MNSREDAFRKLAFTMEMSYLNKDEYGVKSYLSEFELFKNSGGEISHLCQKKSSSLECENNIFDYKYIVVAGKTIITHRQTVYFVNSKSLDLPIFILKPEGLLNKLATYFGIDDIDFQDYPVFSDNYLLKGEDEEFIRHHFDNKVLKFFSVSSGWTVEASNYYLIFYKPQQLVSEEELQDFYKLGDGVYDLFKEVD